MRRGDRLMLASSRRLLTALMHSMHAGWERVSGYFEERDVEKLLLFYCFEVFL
jgi:hypothetical protein